MERPWSTNEASPGAAIAPPIEPLHISKRPAVRRGMVGLAIAAGVFNVLAFPLVRAAEVGGSRNSLIIVLAPFMVAVLLGEVGAMACWLVWSEGPFLRRLAKHWGTGTALVFGYFVGVSLSISPFFNRGLPQPYLLYEMMAIGLLIPAISLAVQLPLWPFRTHLGWRIEWRRDVEADRVKRALSILDILAGTAVVALSLGLVRFVPRAPQSFVFMQLGVVSLAVALMSTVMLLPAMIFILRVSSAGRGIAFYLGATVLSVMGLIVTVSLAKDDWPPGEMFFVATWFSLVFASTVAAPLFVWRACGYRLVWPRNS